jgi:nitrate/nitrite-specific signal transduction histidine kinase
MLARWRRGSGETRGAPGLHWLPAQPMRDAVLAQAMASPRVIVCPWAQAAVCLEIADDGVGLRSMRERAAELGGCCTVVSRPGQGTRVCAQLPLPQDTEAP